MWTQTDIRRPARMPLGEHTWLRSDCPDEASTFLRQEKSIALRVPRAASPQDAFRFDINLASLPRIFIGYTDYSRRLEQTWMDPLEMNYVVHLPLDGWIKLRVGDRGVTCGTGGVAVVSPSNHISLTTSDGCRRLCLGIKRQAFADHLAIMLGDPPSYTLAFVAGTESSQVGTQRLANAVRYTAQEFERKDAISSHEAMVAQFEQFVMTLLLMSQPNNYSEALNRHDNGVRPKDVKRAIDYIHANLDIAITLEELVAASGVPGRTLYQHFQDFVGTSPMGYIKKLRYERVRDDLARLNGERTVTEIAGRWGFSHMGRFAAEYRRRFGELPSVTARMR